MNPAGIPQELRQSPHWLTWRLQERPDKQTGEIKLTKVPFNPKTGELGSSTDAATWATYGHAMGVARAYDGLGFVFSESNDYCGIDLDHCRDPATGAIAAWAEAILREIGSYAELSPSATGIHIICRGKLPDRGRRRPYPDKESGSQIELYDRGRFFTMSGEALADYRRIESRQDALTALYGRLFPPEAPKPVPRTANGHTGLSPDLWTIVRAVLEDPKASALWRGDTSGYASESEADLALTNHVAYYAGPDPVLIEQLLRLSDLLRDKWDRHRTYLNLTITRVIATRGPGDYYGWRTLHEASQPVPAPVIARPWTKASELMQRKIGPMQWIVPQLLPEGLGLIGGRPKQGKSWGVLGLAVAVAAGGKAFGRIAVAQGEVLYLALEDGERRLQQRLESLLHGSPCPEGLYYDTTWPKLAPAGKIMTEADEDCRRRIERWLDDHPHARLVVIDTFAKVRDASRKNGGGTAYDDDYAAMEPLHRLATERRIGLLVVTHTRKPATQRTFTSDFLDEIQGSTGVTGVADTIMGLQKASGLQQVALHVRGRDVEDQELLIAWDKDTGDWTLLGEAAEHRRTEAQAALLQVLRDAEGPLHFRKVAALIGKSSHAEVETVRMQLYRLWQTNAIVQTGQGFYSAVRPHPALPQGRGG